MQSGLSSSAEQSLRLISLLYHIEITALNCQEDIDTFTANHRFHSVQYMFSANSLRRLIGRLPENQVFLVTDAFLIRCMIFYVDGIPVIVGPFSSVILTPRDAKTLFKRYEISNIAENTLLHYVGSYPCIPDAEAVHIVSCLLQILFPEEAAREVVNIDYWEHQMYEVEDKHIMDRENRTRLLEKRYAYEQSFIQNVMAGNARKAIQDLRNMQMDVAYLKRVGTTLENERIGAAIVRTTARHAARQAGLSSVIIDSISTDNTLATRNASTVEGVIKAKEAMVREFCNAVRSYKTQKYSALVQSALYCMEREYSQDITVKSLAEQLNVSVNHLISAFHEEMEVTPNIYLRKIRMKHAARLLAATDQPVQEIASCVGIPDASYLIKLFKAEFGETPAAYRKKYRV